MSVPPNAREAWSQLTKMAQNAQKKGGAPGPKGAGAGLAGLIILGGLAATAQNALFNVDGGHRAIKYTRLGGVKQEIYAEGTDRCGAITATASSAYAYCYTFQVHTSRSHGSRPQ